MDFDVAVIGGGPAGMAAAIESAKTGVKTVLIERDYRLGGILNQCIHNGFGLHYFNEELTGPEYANKFIDLLKNTNVTIMLNTFVIKVDGLSLTVINDNACNIINAKAIVLAMGCRERTAGNINLVGNRPVGIFTAGQVQKMVNYYGKMPGKNIIILGSGDIGLIMARRLTFEGANVKMVLEIMSDSSGLKRNITQCLTDYNIPLLLNTTVTKVVGTNRVEGVYFAKVDDKLQPIKNTENFEKCDCLILSVGLVPEIDLLKNIKINTKTSGPIVNEYRETSYSGIFACGNVLHVHDLVDNVTQESIIAGKNAGYFSKNKLEYNNAFNIICGNGVSYTVPNVIYANNDDVIIYFRVSKRFEKKYIVVKCNDKVLFKLYNLAIIPSQMQKISFSKKLVDGDVIISMEDKV